jgi:hypothetical protein
MSAASSGRDPLPMSPLRYYTKSVSWLGCRLRAAELPGRRKVKEFDELLTAYNDPCATGREHRKWRLECSSHARVPHRRCANQREHDAFHYRRSASWAQPIVRLSLPRVAR